MKELSIEEKAKAYDEVKLKATQKWEAGLIERSELEYLFPELAESEDEKIRQYFINAVEEQVDIHQDWKEKCLNWLKEREPEKNGWLFEKGKWYVKLCHNYNGDLRHFQKGDVYQAISETCITDGYHHISLGSWEIPKYFRPANKDEIPQEIEQSEDERIRKELITHCRNIRCVTEEGAEGIARWISWLEKQCEHANFLSKIQVGDKVTRNQDGMLVNLSQLKRVAKPSEKQCEQKPAWSEEDKKMIGNIRSIIEKYAFSQSAVDVNGDLCEKEYIEADNWLKSLRPQNTWKPSEEEITSLKQAIKNMEDSGCYHSPLVSLYNDLREL